jgi:predicted Zn-dependent protease
MTIGRTDSALAELRRAHELDPVAANIAGNYALVLAAVGRSFEAESLLHRVIRDNPEYQNAHAFLVSVLAGSGRPTAAIDTARHHNVSTISGRAQMAGGLACAYAKAGLVDSARATMRRAAVARDSAMRTGALASAGWWTVAQAVGYAGLGQPDSAAALVPGVMSRTGRVVYAVINGCGGDLLKSRRFMDAMARAAGGGGAPP